MAVADPTYTAIERLRVPLYAFAVLMVAHPVGDFIANVWPLRLGEVQWRYGVMGLLSGFMITPMLGLITAMAVGAIVQDRRLVRVLSWFAMAIGGLLLVMTVFFALEILQFRPTVAAEGLSQYDIGSWKAVAKHLITAPVLILLGRAGLAASKAA